MRSISQLKGFLVLLTWATLNTGEMEAQTPAPPIAPGAGSETVNMIDLPAVLRLAHAQNLDIKLAQQRLSEAKANRDSATWSFFPWVSPGAGYRRHEGRIQAVDGTMFDVDKQSYNVGGTLTAQVDIGDALYRRLAAKQLFNAADQEVEWQRQESTTIAAENYFELAKAKGLANVLREALKILQDYQNQ